MDVQIAPLLKLSSIDAPPKFLQSLQDAGKFVKKLCESDPDIVNSTVNCSGNEEEHRALQAGLLYLALTEPDRRKSYCTDIVLTSRDNLTYVLSEMTRLVAETWPKMFQNVRVNLISLLNDLISTRASVEVLMLHLFRRMTTGDLGSANIWLIENIVDLLEKNKEWLGNPDRQAFLLPLTVFTLLRIIPDHHSAPPNSSSGNQSAATQPQSLSPLRHRELLLTEELIRKHFDRCAQIGRDFIRLLQGVARLDPMRRLWVDILRNLPSLSSHFSNVAEILEIPTPQFFMQTLIPHEMEQWARWMMKNVHCIPRVPVNRYQDFFQRKFFSTPESQSLRVCLLRYIVTYFYPDNEMLASTLIPRWNVISWILSQSTCAVVTSNAKLALFYDWLFFKPNDCIMNIEPALLAMMNHLAPRTQPIALSLVDFLIKIVGTYHPPMTERIIAGIRTGLEEMIRLGVVKNINPLFEMLHRVSPDMLRALRTLLGCELPSATPSVVTGEKSESTEDTNTMMNSTQLPMGLIHPTASLPLRRPSTPPLTSNNKLKHTASEGGGSLTDPRLTRGHAAILAGAVTPSVTNSSDDNSMKHSSSDGPAIDSPSLINIDGHPPPILMGLPNLNAIDESKSKPFRPPLPPISVPSAKLQHTHSDIIISETNLDKSDINPVVDDRPQASWSPPPLPSSQRVYRPRTEQLSEVPESLELTIDNLRRRFQEYHLRYHYSVKPVDVNALIGQLDGPICTALEEFRDLAIRVELVRDSGDMICADRGGDELDTTGMVNGTLDQRPNSVRLRSASVLGDLCDAMESLVQAVLAEDCFDDLEIAGRTAAVVAELLFPLFAERLMPVGTEWSDEQLEDCLAFPIFVPFRHLWQMNPGDPKRELLLLLLTEMQTRQPRLGYHLLFFLKVAKLNDETMSIYRSFCASQENPNLRDSLFKDMQLLADDNRRLFSYLLPDIYTVFASELSNDVTFIHLVVSTIDPGMCNTLICEIVRGHLNMFQSDDLSPVLRASLQWNSIEQYFFWQLINAHEIPTRSFLPLVKYVDPAKHPEACANLILLLKLEKPSFELVRALLSRSGVNDALSVTALHFWSCPDNQHSSRFASILKSLIMAPLSQRGDGSLSNSTTTGSASRDGREKRRNGAKNQVTPDNQVELSLILTHLDSIRRTCRNISLLQDEDVQLALQEVVRSSKVPLSVKDHFSDLLALAEDQSVTSPANRYGVSQNGRSISDPLHRLSGTTTDGAENSSLLSRPASLGSKGGHSLRNLDSRRAAEAERRQLPTSAGSHSNKRSSRTSGHQNDALDSDLTDETEAVSILSSSSDSSEDDDDDGDEKRQANSMRLIKRKKHSSANSCNSSGTTRPALGKQSDTAAESSYKDRRPSCKRVLQRFTGAAENDDEEDDDDDDKGLEVVVLDEESGDEKTNEDADRVRPPKRRKTAVNRFLLDD